MEEGILTICRRQFKVCGRCPVYGTLSMLEFNHQGTNKESHPMRGKNCIPIAIILGILFLPFGIIFALAKNYR